jgi:hypothetical protein
MRASDHFYSELDAIARRGETDLHHPERAFLKLAVPVVGEVAAGELFHWWAERHASAGSVGWAKLGHIASFVLGDYDDSTMDLDSEDWAAIRDIVSAEAEELDLDDLTRLMADLVSRGALS